MDQLKLKAIKAIKATMSQMFATATVDSIITLLVLYITSAPSKMPTWFWVAASALAVVYVWYRINYVRQIPDPEHTNWIERKSEEPPKCQLIHAELITSQGKKKMLWRKRPTDVDFSNDAPEPVICYLVVKK
ncbi:hypothetical protein OKZ62_001853 [Vibrio navarrensis]|nr:hypothetical protein [Vibrio navarrensis]